MDNFSTGSRQNLDVWRGNDCLRIVEADICDGIFSPLLALGKDMRIERIVHLAAQTSVVHSMIYPLRDIHNNYIATAHVLEFARAQAVKKVVFASSCAVYSDNNVLPITEDADTVPVSPYAINKLACEHLVALYVASYGVPATTLRFFNVFGPRQRASSGYAGVISLFCHQAAKGEPLIIHGDGTQSRDFIFVGDIVRAICAAADAAASGSVINIGTGRETRIVDLAMAIRELTGSASELQFEQKRAGSIHRSVASIDRAHQFLDFRPQYDLYRGLEATVAWRRTLRRAAA